jgi:hypothetical protein
MAGGYLHYVYINICKGGVGVMEVSKEILEAVENASREKQISCTEARRLAEELKIPPRLIGEAANKLKIKIRACELGCF